MRRSDKKIDEPAIINEIFTNSLICRVGLFDEKYPYIIPMNYGYSNSILYFHSASNGKKIDLIKRNNNVCFEIEQEHEILIDDLSCNWTTKYRSIIGFGEMEIINDFDEKRNSLDIIMKQHGKSENSYKDMMIKNIVILKCNIKSYTAKQSGEW